MAGLQRSSVSFRRQGSSGLVWEDRLLSGDLNQMKQKDEGVELRELRHSQSVGSVGMMDRSRSGGGRWRTVKVSPAIEPPSPKVSGCGLFCRVLGRSATTKQRKSGKRYQSDVYFCFCLQMINHQLVLQGLFHVMGCLFSTHVCIYRERYISYNSCTSVYGPFELVRNTILNYFHVLKLQNKPTWIYLVCAIYILFLGPS